MKKLLFGTAIAALFTAPAAAGPIAVTVGGYYNSMVYSVDSDNVGSNFEDISLQEDAEIIFKGKGKSDTGLEFGFQVQLEEVLQPLCLADDLTRYRYDAPLSHACLFGLSHLQPLSQEGHPQ